MHHLIGKQKKTHRSSSRQIYLKWPISDTFRYRFTDDGEFGCRLFWETEELSLSRGVKILNERFTLSGYRSIWLFAMFDLPVKTKDARREYVRFRDALLAERFTMIQFSVYARNCASADAAASYRRRVRRTLPPEGQVRLLSATNQ